MLTIKPRCPRRRKKMSWRLEVRLCAVCGSGHKKEKNAVSFACVCVFEEVACTPVIRPYTLLLFSKISSTSSESQMEYCRRKGFLDDNEYSTTCTS
mmetsp:Transcript_46877/g.52928  ORF Transcript_46877/g.52928 Transcript_46877/m.52928 type:complete len:96 (-) Transcript_46877:434-721(-)